MLSLMAQYSAQLDGVVVALADPTRRAVVRRLGHGPTSVGDLAREFPMTLPSFMKHVRTLESNGLTRTARTTGWSSGTATRRPALITRSSASPRAGVRSPASWPRSPRARPRDEDHPYRVRHARRGQPGPRLAGGGHQRRIRPRRLARSPHGRDVRPARLRLARPRRRPAARTADLRGVRTRLAEDHRPGRPVRRADEHH